MTLLIIRRAGLVEDDDEDEYGNPVALEDMSDEKLEDWKEIVKSLGKDSPLAIAMLEQIDEEVDRRKAKAAGAFEELEEFDWAIGER